MKSQQVLIDTWWNVNGLIVTGSNTSLAVLIDTWWNVNYFLYHSGMSASGFNRYMVECEYKPLDISIFEEKCFNRYMVECEF